MPKRRDYISWDEYFMGIASLSAMRSKDPSSQVGCCIVDPNRRIAAVGYNGFPEGISDDEFPWERKAGSPLDTKYMYVAHAELNAILNAKEPLRGCVLYTTLYPCNECAKAIIQCGISKVVYLENKYEGTDSVIASGRMLGAAGIEVREFGTQALKISYDGESKR